MRAGRTAPSWTIAVATLLGALCLGPQEAAAQRGAATPMTCADLSGLSVPKDQIGLPTHGAQVTSATLIVASGTSGAGEYCKVTADILPIDPTAPPIKMEVSLPADWNLKTLM